MKLSIMQPYFMPYIGYFQLLHASDKFVIYDNIQFTKKGWIKRNRFLNNNKEQLFTIPLKKDSSLLDIRDRSLSDMAKKENERTIRRIEAAYLKAPFFSDAMPIINDCFANNNENLFSFIYNSIKVISNYLMINTEIIKSSSISADHSLKKEDRVIDLCISLDASAYINLSGGIDLYSKERFLDNNIELYFIKSLDTPYGQFNDSFVPRLSIVDVMMFNSAEEISKNLINDFEIF